MVVSLPLARVPAARSNGASGTMDTILQALRRALGNLGTAYTIAPYTLAALTEECRSDQAERIADADRRTINQRAHVAPAPVLFACGLATLHRNDDPATVLDSPENCLAVAEATPISRVSVSGSVGERNAPRQQAR